MPAHVPRGSRVNPNPNPLRGTAEYQHGAGRMARRAGCVVVENEPPDDRHYRDDPKRMAYQERLEYFVRCVLRDTYHHVVVPAGLYTSIVRMRLVSDGYSKIYVEVQTSFQPDAFYWPVGRWLRVSQPLKEFVSRYAQEVAELRALRLTHAADPEMVPVAEEAPKTWRRLSRWLLRTWRHQLVTSLKALQTVKAHIRAFSPDDEGGVSTVLELVPEDEHAYALALCPVSQDLIVQNKPQEAGFRHPGMTKVYQQCCKTRGRWVQWCSQPRDGLLAVAQGPAAGLRYTSWLVSLADGTKEMRCYYFNHPCHGIALADDDAMTAFDYDQRMAAVERNELLWKIVRRIQAALAALAPVPVVVRKRKRKRKR